VTELRTSARPAPTQLPYGVLLRVRGRGDIFDVVAYQDAILLSRAGGTDPALVGALVGLIMLPVIGAVFGALIGERVAQHSATRRLQDLFYSAPEYLFDTDKRNRFIRSSDVRTARLWEYGARQRVLEVQLHDGSKRRLKFDARFQSNSYAAETLRIGLGPSFEIEQRRYRPASIVAGVVLVVLVALIATMLVAFLVGAVS
jgi:hypothetical protein